jgi:hypothetical protein
LIRTEDTILATANFGQDKELFWDSQSKTMIGHGGRQQNEVNGRSVMLSWAIEKTKPSERKLFRML